MPTGRHSHLFVCTQPVHLPPPGNNDDVKDDDHDHDHDHGDDDRHHYDDGLCFNDQFVPLQWRRQWREGSQLIRHSHHSCWWGT